MRAVSPGVLAWTDQQPLLSACRSGQCGLLRLQCLSEIQMPLGAQASQGDDQQAGIPWELGLLKRVGQS